MIKLEYEQLRALAKNQLCAEHHEILEVVWVASENCHTLKCRMGEFPEALERNPSNTELWRQKLLPAGPVSDNIMRREAKKHMSQQRQPVDPKMAMVPQLDLATGQLLLPEEVKGLIAYAEKYDLDPYRGHVVLMYGKPYVTLDGYLYHATQLNVPYNLHSAPLGKDERESYQIAEGDHAWIAEVVNLNTGSKFSGLGIVTMAEMSEESKSKPGQLRSPVVAKHPWQLVQKRAEWQAMRRAFPIGGEKPEEEEQAK